MKVDKATLRKIAHLGRLNFNDKNEEKMLNSLNDILDWIEKLKEVDTENIEPQLTMSEEVNVLREDVAQEPLPHQLGLKNAPKKDSDYFRVPKVIE